MGNEISITSYGPTEEHAAESLVCLLENNGFTVKEHEEGVGVAKKLVRTASGTLTMDVVDYGVHLLVFERIKDHNIKSAYRWAHL